jgi:glutamyl/glutaminyl-tRNA synthetase
VRIAVTGSTVSPSIDKTLELLGRVKAMDRLTQALIEFEKELERRN